MHAEKKKNVKIWDKIAIGVLVIYGVVMILAFNHDKIIYNAIHNNIDSDMPGYEIPIAKNIELVNNRITDEIAYVKYNCAPNEYAKKKEELAKDKEKAASMKQSNLEILKYPQNRYSSSYKLTYYISQVEEIKLEEMDRNKGVTNMYDVKFEIAIFGNDAEAHTSTYRRKVAEIDGSWIFYDEYWDALNFISGWYNITNPGGE